jgi:hypothetical protein
MTNIKEYTDKISSSEGELVKLINLIANYKRERAHYEALGKKDTNTIVMNDDGNMVLRTTVVSAFVQAGDFELDFLRQLIREFKTSEKAFEKFQELIDITWKGWLPPYTFSAFNFYDLAWSEEVTKNCTCTHHLCSRIELGFDKFLDVLRGDFKK